MEFLIDKRTGAKNCTIDSDYERFNENKDKLSPNEIRQIASDYWKIKDGDIDPETGSILYLFEKYGYDGTFYVDLVLFSDRKEFSIVKSMNVNAHTGEITIPDWCK